MVVCEKLVIFRDGALVNLTFEGKVELLDGFNPETLTVLCINRPVDFTRTGKQIEVEKPGPCECWFQISTLKWSPHFLLHLTPDYLRNSSLTFSVDLHSEVQVSGPMVIRNDSLISSSSDIYFSRSIDQKSLSPGVARVVIETRNMELIHFWKVKCEVGEWVSGQPGFLLPEKQEWPDGPVLIARPEFPSQVGKFSQRDNSILMQPNADIRVLTRIQEQKKSRTGKLLSEKLAITARSEIPAEDSIEYWYPLEGKEVESETAEIRENLWITHDTIEPGETTLELPITYYSSVPKENRIK